jgi:hypothetical protein
VRTVRFIRVQLRDDPPPTESFATEVTLRTNVAGAEVVGIPVEYLIGD